MWVNARAEGPTSEARFSGRWPTAQCKLEGTRCTQRAEGVPGGGTSELWVGLGPFGEFLKWAVPKLGLQW